MYTIKKFFLIKEVNFYKYVLTVEPLEAHTSRLDTLPM